MNQAFHLSRLQKIDTQIDQTNNKLKEIARLLADSEPVIQAKKKLDEAQKTLKKARQGLKIIEDNVQTQRIKLETSEASLYSGKIKNPKELQDLQRETASLKKHIGTLEDEQLEAMDVVEKAESVEHTAAAEYEQAVALETSQKAALRGEQSSLEKNLERLHIERGPIIAALEQDNIQIYDRLRQSRRGVAVATLVEESCSACGSNLRPEILQAARSPLQVVYCDSCGRILYTG